MPSRGWLVLVVVGALLVTGVVVGTNVVSLDGDDLDDGREVDDLGTDPTTADTDGDGLED